MAQHHNNSGFITVYSQIDPHMDYHHIVAVDHYAYPVRRAHHPWFLLSTLADAGCAVIEGLEQETAVLGMAATWCLDA